MHDLILQDWHSDKKWQVRVFVNLEFMIEYVQDCEDFGVAKNHGFVGHLFGVYVGESLVFRKGRARRSPEFLFCLLLLFCT